MKHAVVALIALGLFVVPANAVGLRVFFAPQGVGPGTALGGVTPTLAVPQGGPYTPASPGRFYMWARLEGGNGNMLYLSWGVNIRATGNVNIVNFVPGVNGNIYNYYNGDTDVYRWQGYNNGDYSATSLLNVRVMCGTAGYFGIRDKNYLNSDLQWDPTTKSTLLGYLDVTGSAGGLFYQVGDLGIIRSGGTWEPVYFGFGDDALGLMGNSKQLPTGSETGFLLDAKIVPEPASLLLLGLTGLLLRRR